MRLAFHFMEGATRTLPIFPLSLVLALLGGCAVEQSPVAHVTEPAFLVPSAAIIGGRGAGPAATASAVLPSSDGDYDFVRGEKAVYGATPLGETSYYTTYTFDSQAIGIPRTGGTGYRYRWVVQQGEQSP